MDTILHHCNFSAQISYRECACERDRERERVRDRERERESERTLDAYFQLESEWKRVNNINERLLEHLLHLIYTRPAVNDQHSTSIPSCYLKAGLHKAMYWVIIMGRMFLT